MDRGDLEPGDALRQGFAGLRSLLRRDLRGTVAWHSWPPPRAVAGTVGPESLSHASRRAVLSLRRGDESAACMGRRRLLAAGLDSRSSSSAAVSIKTRIDPEARLSYPRVSAGRSAADPSCRWYALLSLPRISTNASANPMAAKPEPTRKADWKPSVRA
jgi:hypothetical protein